MAADLQPYKEAIANAYEGRAVRDAIVAMVQAVEDAINAGGGSGSSELETRLSSLEGIVNGDGGLVTRVTYLENCESQFRDAIDELDDRVTALEGGSTNENDT